MVDWTKVLTDVLLAVLTIIAVPLGKYLGAWLKANAKKVEAEIESHLNATQFDMLKKFAQVAVQAAEQSGLVTAAQEKKTFAIQVVENMLLQAGIDIDIDVIDAQIEAAVLTEFNSGK